MPLISIVLPTYNRPHLLPLAVESILNQTYRDLELIVINNGSEEPTAEVLASYSDPRLRVITLNENIGFAQASNLGFDAIEGDWFTLMSDDDNLLPEALERLMAVPQEIDSAVNAVSCNCFSMNTQEFT
ncbi:MAG: glycosyltransferase family 2 protein, partial [Bacteroidota bacterium]